MSRHMFTTFLSGSAVISSSEATILVVALGAFAVLQEMFACGYDLSALPFGVMSVGNLNKNRTFHTSVGGHITGRSEHYTSISVPDGMDPNVVIDQRRRLLQYDSSKASGSASTDKDEDVATTVKDILSKLSLHNMTVSQSKDELNFGLTSPYR